MRQLLTRQLLILALFTLITEGCKKKEHCSGLNDISTSGILIGDPFCTQTAYVIADREFGASYVPSAGNDDTYNYNWVAGNGFDPISGSNHAHVQHYKAPKNGSVDICLTIEDLCGDKTETACRRVEALNTAYIYYSLGAYEPINNPDVIPGPVNTFNFSHKKAFAYNGKGYVILGNESGKSLFEYDPSLEKWIQKTSFAGTTNNNLRQYSVVVKNDMAYIFGYHAVWHLNMSTFALTKATDYPSGVDDGVLFSVMFDDDIYVATSKDPTSLVDPNRLYLYNPSSKTLTQKADLPYNDDPGNFAHQVGSQIIVGGGTTDNVFEHDEGYYAYTPSFDSWAPSSIASVDVAVVDFVYNDTIFIITHESDMYYLDEFQNAFIEVDIDPDSWPTCLKPQPRMYLYYTTENWCSGFVIGDKLHIVESRTGIQDPAITVRSNFSSVLRLKPL